MLLWEHNQTIGDDRVLGAIFRPQLPPSLQAKYLYSVITLREGNTRAKPLSTCKNRQFQPIENIHIDVGYSIAARLHHTQQNHKTPNHIGSISSKTTIFRMVLSFREISPSGSDFTLVSYIRKNPETVLNPLRKIPPLEKYSSSVQQIYKSAMVYHSSAFCIFRACASGARPSRTATFLPVPLRSWDSPQEWDPERVNPGGKRYAVLVICNNSRLNMSQFGEAARSGDSGALAALSRVPPLQTPLPVVTLHCLVAVLGLRLGYGGNTWVIKQSEGFHKYAPYATDIHATPPPPRPLPPQSQTSVILMAIVSRVTRSYQFPSAHKHPEDEDEEEKGMDDGMVALAPGDAGGESASIRICW